MASSGPNVPTRLQLPEGDNLILLIGAARSGTTWVAKVFDSHPDVIYRHEPDMVIREEQLADARALEDEGTRLELARAYLGKLAGARALKATGSLPHFPKRYRSPRQNLLHGSLVLAARSLQTIRRDRLGLDIPDMTMPGRTPKRVVIKTVTLRGIAGLLARALPRCRVIFIVRHPCGQVNSLLRGIREHRFEHDDPFDDVAATSEAQSVGLSRSAFDSLNLVEQCAWNWAVLNQKVANDLAGLATVRTVRFRDAYAQPVDIARQLFEFAGLDWNRQTEGFVTRTTQGRASRRYYSVWRYSPDQAEKWKTELGPTDQERILAIANRFPVGRIFDE